eukprot:gnl/Chilomastix_cuspidata/2952.p1 GENE.gnl/Chilomastix_cuspidata/2952~~gnl/Chilomastix_cuspidata/2952.p1  ORF type:complete len:2754 (+),score=475.20 gnl/Chilomastix_cuspidata/2952:555-8264(+)
MPFFSSILCDGDFRIRKFGGEFLSFLLRRISGDKAAAVLRDERLGPAHAQGMGVVLRTSLRSGAGVSKTGPALIAGVTKTALGLCEDVVSDNMQQAAAQSLSALVEDLDGVSTQSLMAAMRALLATIAPHVSASLAAKQKRRKGKKRTTKGEEKPGTRAPHEGSIIVLKLLSIALTLVWKLREKPQLAQTVEAFLSRVLEDNKSLRGFASETSYSDKLLMGILALFEAVSLVEDSCAKPTFIPLLPEPLAAGFVSMTLSMFSRKDLERVLLDTLNVSRLSGSDLELFLFVLRDSSSALSQEARTHVLSQLQPLGPAKNPMELISLLALSEWAGLPVAGTPSFAVRDKKAKTTKKANLKNVYQISQQEFANMDSETKKSLALYFRYLSHTDPEFIEKFNKTIVNIPGLLFDRSTALFVSEIGILPPSFAISPEQIAKSWDIRVAFPLFKLCIKVDRIPSKVVGIVKAVLKLCKSALTSVPHDVLQLLPDLHQSIAQCKASSLEQVEEGWAVSALITLLHIRFAKLWPEVFSAMNALGLSDATKTLTWDAISTRMISTHEGNSNQFESFRGTRCLQKFSFQKHQRSISSLLRANGLERLLEAGTAGASEASLRFPFMLLYPPGFLGVAQKQFENILDRSCISGEAATIPLSPPSTQSLLEAVARNAEKSKCMMTPKSLDYLCIVFKELKPAQKVTAASLLLWCRYAPSGAIWNTAYDAILNTVGDLRSLNAPWPNSYTPQQLSLSLLYLWAPAIRPYIPAILEATGPRLRELLIRVKFSQEADVKTQSLDLAAAEIDLEELGQFRKTISTSFDRPIPDSVKPKKMSIRESQNILESLKKNTGKKKRLKRVTDFQAGKSDVAEEDNAVLIVPPTDRALFLTVLIPVLITRVLRKTSNASSKHKSDRAAVVGFLSNLNWKDLTLFVERAVFKLEPTLFALTGKTTSIMSLSVPLKQLPADLSRVPDPNSTVITSFFDLATVCMDYLGVLFAPFLPGTLALALFVMISKNKPFVDHKMRVYANNLLSLIVRAAPEWALRENLELLARSLETLLKKDLQGVTVASDSRLEKGFFKGKNLLLLIQQISDRSFLLEMEAYLDTPAISKELILHLSKVNIFEDSGLSSAALSLDTLTKRTVTNDIRPEFLRAMKHCLDALSEKKGRLSGNECRLRSLILGALLTLSSEIADASEPSADVVSHTNNLSILLSKIAGRKDTNEKQRNQALEAIQTLTQTIPPDPKTALCVIWELRNLPLRLNRKERYHFAECVHQVLSVLEFSDLSSFVKALSSDPNEVLNLEDADPLILAITQTHKFISDLISNDSIRFQRSREYIVLWFLLSFILPIAVDQDMGLRCAALDALRVLFAACDPIPPHVEELVLPFLSKTIQLLVNGKAALKKPELSTETIMIDIVRFINEYTRRFAMINASKKYYFMNSLGSDSLEEIFSPNKDEQIRGLRAISRKANEEGSRTPESLLKDEASEIKPDPLVKRVLIPAVLIKSRSNELSVRNVAEKALSHLTKLLSFSEFVSLAHSFAQQRLWNALSTTLFDTLTKPTPFRNFPLSESEARRFVSQLMPLTRSAVSKVTKDNASAGSSFFNVRSSKSPIHCLAVYCRLLLLSPTDQLKARLKFLFGTLANVCADSLEVKRDAGRAALVKVMTILYDNGKGFDMRDMMVSVFQTFSSRLDRGYQRHVLSFTISYTVSELRKLEKKHLHPFGPLFDRIPKKVAAILIRDSLGIVGEEKDVSAIQKKSKEQSSNTSYTLAFTAGSELTVNPSLRSNSSPFHEAFGFITSAVEEIEEEEDLEQMRAILFKLSQGLALNRSVSPELAVEMAITGLTDVFRLSAAFLEKPKRQQGQAGKKLTREEISYIAPRPNLETVHTKLDSATVRLRNLSVIHLFFVDVVLSTVKVIVKKLRVEVSKPRGTDKEFILRASTLFQIIADKSATSRHMKIANQALRVLARLPMKLPLHNIRTISNKTIRCAFFSLSGIGATSLDEVFMNDIDESEAVKKTKLDPFHESSSAQIAKTALKIIQGVKLAPTDATLAISFVKKPILNRTLNMGPYNLVLSVVRHGTILTDIYTLLNVYPRMLATTTNSRIRTVIAETLSEFLISYPMKIKRRQRHIAEILRVGAEAEAPEAQTASLAIIHQVIGHLPKKEVDQFAEAGLLLTVAAFANSSDRTTREAAVSVIEAFSNARTSVSAHARIANWIQLEGAAANPQISCASMAIASTLLEQNAEVARKICRTLSFAKLLRTAEDCHEDRWEIKYRTLGLLRALSRSAFCNDFNGLSWAARAVSRENILASHAWIRKVTADIFAIVLKQNGALLAPKGMFDCALAVLTALREQEIEPALADAAGVCLARSVVAIASQPDVFTPDLISIHKTARGKRRNEDVDEIILPEDAGEELVSLVAQWKRDRDEPTHSCASYFCKKFISSFSAAPQTSHHAFIRAAATFTVLDADVFRRLSPFPLDVVTRVVEGRTDSDVDSKSKADAKKVHTLIQNKLGFLSNVCNAFIRSGTALKRAERTRRSHAQLVANPHVASQRKRERARTRRQRISATEKARRQGTREARPE